MSKYGEIVQIYSFSKMLQNMWKYANSKFVFNFDTSLNKFMTQV